MWYLKQTASNVWNASKNFIDKRTPAQKIIDSLSECQEQILPTNKLNELAAMTYEMDNFDIILECLTRKLKVFHYDFEKSQQTYNILVTTNYLIKHGASGFVDEFRLYLGVFKKYQTLKPIQTYDDDILQKKLDYNLQRIKSRANHIQVLLEDKNKLLKEKQLSMLVKQKLKLYEKDKISKMKQEPPKDRSPSSVQNNRGLQINAEDFSTKLQGLMERYLWKYVDKLDETIQTASQKVMSQIDKYVLGEQPHPFQVQQPDQEQAPQNKKMREQKSEDKAQQTKKVQYKNLLDDDDDLMKKLSEEGQSSNNAKNDNLLEFEQVIDKQEQNSKQEKDKGEDLI